MMFSSLLDARLFERQVQWFDRLDARVEKGEEMVWSEYDHASVYRSVSI